MDEYSSHYGDWQWNVPTRLNIATACAHQWATIPIRRSEIAVRWEDELGAFDAHGSVLSENDGGVHLKAL